MNNTIQKNNSNKNVDQILMDKINASKNDVVEILKTKTCPIVITYSGGKDSTVALDIFLSTLVEYKKENEVTNDIYILNYDTLVENPILHTWTSKNMNWLQEFSDANNLNLKVLTITPEYNETFWALMIGKGYPSPLPNFRWCTDWIKIRPANRFFDFITGSYTEIIVALGVRTGESTNRDKVLEKHKLKTKILSPHPSLPNASVFHPVYEFSTDDIWRYLIKHKETSTWGELFDFMELATIYTQNSTECPLVTDQAADENNKQTCGSSRFGCWCCTVANSSADKTMLQMIEQGYEEYHELLNFRYFLTDIRNNRKYRNKFQRNGNVKISSPIPREEDYLVFYDVEQIPIVELEKNKKYKNFVLTTEEELDDFIAKSNINLENNELDIIIKGHDGEYRALQVGSFNFEGRKEILEKLLETSINLNGFKVITEEEIKEIQKFWAKDGSPYNAIEIWNNMMNEHMMDTTIKITNPNVDKDLVAFAESLLNSDADTVEEMKKELMRKMKEERYFFKNEI